MAAASLILIWSLLIIPISFLSFSRFSTATSQSHPPPNDNHTHLQHQLHQCLLAQNNLHSFPISLALHFPSNATYTSTLNAHIRNLRFTTPTTPKPILIVTPLHTTHIQTTVTCARRYSLLIKIRSGGHDYEGLSYTTRVSSSSSSSSSVSSSSSSPFLLLDMSRLNSISIHLKPRTATVQSGATIGELFHAISQRSTTLAFPAGICPTVGVGGHFSAGGYGPLIRKHGITADHILDAELVDVEGRLLDRRAMGEDLFWAIRGGGAGSFGVVVSYTVKLVTVPRNVTVFKVERTNDDDDDGGGEDSMVVEWMHEAYKMVDDLFIRLTIDVVRPNTVRSTFRALYLGGSSELLSLMRERLPAMGVKLTECHEMSWVESVLFWYDFPLGTTTPTAVLLLDRPQGSTRYLKRKSDYLTEVMGREAVREMMEKLLELGDQDGDDGAHGPYIAFNPYGGRMWEVGEGEVPFPHRKGCLYKIQYVMDWKEEGEDDKWLGKVRELYGFMTRYVSKGPTRRGFFNYRDIELGVNGHGGKWSYHEARRFGVKYFMSNFDRLVDVKTRVDPDNFFRNEQSIPVLPRRWRTGWN